MTTRIEITALADDSIADPDHEFGLTDDAWLELTNTLDDLGFTDVIVRRTRSHP